MKTLRIIVVLCLAAACATQPPTATTPQPVESRAPLPQPPSTAVRPVTDVVHGVSITDPYRWLEEQESPETRAWIDAQNRYTDAILGNRPEREAFAARYRELSAIDQVSIPTYRNGRYFFTRRPAGADLYSIYMRDASGTDQLLIDPLTVSPDKSASVGIEDVSHDGKLLSYYIRRGGADEVEVRFFDVDARREVGTPLPLARYFTIHFTRDKQQVYFSRHTAGGSRISRRAVSGGAEEKLFGDDYGPKHLVYGSISHDRKYLLIHGTNGSSPTKTEVYVKDLTTDGPIRTVVDDLDARTFGYVADDTLILQTNWNAPNDRLMAVSIANPQRANWRELVAENPNAAVQSVALAGGRIFVAYLENVRPRIVAYTLAGRQDQEIAFDTLGKVLDVYGEWDQPFAFYAFSSFHVPETIYAHHVATKERGVFHRANVPVDSSQFTVEQLWFHSHDGTRVPMFVLYRKGLQKNGANPTIMTGYGGFTNSMLPGFSARAITWAEQGGVYALVNLRGGAEFGERWHRAGMLDQKQNTFDDFVAAAEHLIRERYTSSRHLGISGGSNGGLLVMAAAVQRPELFGAVLCTYPLIDMVRYHQFLVGRFWVSEYGSAEDPDQFRYIHAYSPYHHVKRGTKYPATLFITGDADTRVAPLHARKMTALMQAAQGGDDPILLRYHVALGHSSTGTPLSVTVKNEAEILSFFAWQLR